MSNWIDCTLEILVVDPKEINEIATLLQKPSTEFLLWEGTVDTWPPRDAEVEGLHELFAFQAVTNLG